MIQTGLDPLATRRLHPQTLTNDMEESRVQRTRTLAGIIRMKHARMRGSRCLKAPESICWELHAAKVMLQCFVASCWVLGSGGMKMCDPECQWLLADHWQHPVGLPDRVPNAPNSSPIRLLPDILTAFSALTAMSTSQRNGWRRTFTLTRTSAIRSQHERQSKCKHGCERITITIWTSPILGTRTHQ